MKAHGLVAQRVKAHRCQIIRCRDFQLIQRIVLELACRLAENVDCDERDDIGPIGGKHLIGAYTALAHAVDDEAHDVRVAIRKQRHEKKRRYDKAPKQALMLARYLPVVMQRAARGRLLHVFPLAPYCSSMKPTR